VTNFTGCVEQGAARGNFFGNRVAQPTENPTTKKSSDCLSAHFKCSEDNKWLEKFGITTTTVSDQKTWNKNNNNNNN
jgi:hypothetical protein